MSSTDPAGAADPRLEDAGEDHPGVAPGPVDLIALETTRRGLTVAAPGLFLVLSGVIPIEGSGLPVSGPLIAMRVTGWALLALGLLLASPTPNGPLPAWLRPLYVLVCLGGASRVLYHRLVHAVHFDAGEAYFVYFLWIAFLALPWILWRFTQHRGLTGRAITWLWCALALASVFAINFVTRSSWALWLCPGIGLALALNARATARDVWLDAVYKSARAHRPDEARAYEPLR